MTNLNLENILNSEANSTAESILSITPNEYGGIYEKPKAPKTSFLKSRMNKDNFWNLMFFLGWNVGFGIAYLVKLVSDNDTLFSLTMWVVLLIVPYVIKKNSHITFDKEKLQFLDRNNTVLNDRAPHFFLMLVTTIVGCGFTMFLMESLENFIAYPIAFSIFFMMITFIPTLYCILKNFPIAVYFKKETYIGDGTTRSYTTGVTSSTYNPHSESSLTKLCTSPINSWYSGNIYNRNR